MNLIGIYYHIIIDKRKEKDQKENIKFFCKELLKIEECRKIIGEIFKSLGKEE